MAIPASFIQDLISRTDVVEVVGRHVTLKKAGANFTGLCPFHDEKSPSFSVSPVKQFYHCFGCGVSGDAIKFLTEYTGASFVEAVQDLAQQAGLVVPQDDVPPQERERMAAQRQRQATLTEVLEKAGEAYRKQLRGSARAVQYFKGRGVSGAMAQRFGLGYAPEGWRALASVFPAYDDPLLVESGLVIAGEQAEDVPESQRKRYDRFRDRVMFPIRNVKGECIGFGGRVLGDEKPKYLNSPETPVFSKGRELYGLFEARQALRDKGYALVTEGYMDVVALAQWGFANAVATLGTACTTEHVQKLFRFTDTVVFSFDGDKAGRRAARKALEAALPFATDVRAVRFLFLPTEHDPDSFIRAEGQEAFARQVAEAVPLSRFLLDAAREDCDTATAEGRARMASQARPLWSSMPDGALRRQLLGDIASAVQLDAAELSSLWGKPQRGDRRPAEPASVDPFGMPDFPPPGDPGDPGEYVDAGQPYQSAPSTPRKRSGSGFGDGGRWTKTADGKWKRPEPVDPYAEPPSRGRRTPGISRADTAARLLLRDTDALEALSHEDRELLSALPAPHGPLFVWLEGQLHEHGPQPWAALREGLQGHAGEATALRVMQGPQAEIESDPGDLRGELRDVLDRMLIEHLKAEETAAIAAAATDPTAIERYRALQSRRQALESNPRTP
ncbi:DNA primase [Xylophilus sp. GOD-11R]|uniref:DNA primase n=1 Tax=Xylophilus sp. GOD-11R TaxID=3089814 RepID=UPI00298C13E5|nr:DNA primase [Xylophilus sp. GOD-11R]WPB58068.1 DNA primase [Xylophilus sp. GOD-11R]